MTVLARYQELKDAVDAAQRRVDRAIGVEQQMTKQLQEQFKCATIKEAKARLVALEEHEALLSKDFEKALAAFEKKHAHVLHP